MLKINDAVQVIQGPRLGETAIVMVEPRPVRTLPVVVCVRFNDGEQRWYKQEWLAKSP